MSKLDKWLEQLEEIKQEILEMKNNESSEPCEDIPIEADWRDTRDLLEFNFPDNERIEIACNYDSWNYVKEINCNDVLMIDVYDIFGDACVGLNVRQMIKLRDYLTQKINFLIEDSTQDDVCTICE